MTGAGGGRIDPNDRLAAVDVLHRYGHSYDEGDFAALGRCFTDDAVFTIVGSVGAMPTRMRGREGIVTAMRARREQTAPAQRRHLITNVVLDADGPDRLRAASYLLLGSTEGGALRLPVTGRYVDVLARTDAGWAIAERTLALDGVVS